MNIKKTYIDFQVNIKKHGLISHYNIIAYPLLCIDDIYVRQIPCSCSEYLRKLDYPRNRSQDK